LAPEADIEKLMMQHVLEIGLQQASELIHATGILTGPAAASAVRHNGMDPGSAGASSLLGARH